MRYRRDSTNADGAFGTPLDVEFVQRAYGADAARLDTYDRVIAALDRIRASYGNGESGVAAQAVAGCIEWVRGMRAAVDGADSRPTCARCGGPGPVLRDLHVADHPYACEACHSAWSGEKPLESSMKQKATTLQEDLDVLDGKPPYDVPENICRNDAYYGKSLEQKWGAPLDELRRRVAKRADAKGRQP